MSDIYDNSESCHSATPSRTAILAGSQDNGYRLQLWNKLSENEKDFVRTQPIGNMQDPDNKGYNGATISEISNWCGNALAMRPNVVLIHVGTNNMNQPFEPDTAPTRLGQLIDKVASNCPDAAILVVRIIPASGPGTMSWINAFNEKVSGIVESRANDGKKVMVVGMTMLTTSELQDGLHSTDSGYDHGRYLVFRHCESRREGLARGSCSCRDKQRSTGLYLASGLVSPEIASGMGSSEAFTSVWYPKGEIASGVGAGTGVRFGDIDRDGREDYLWVSSKGAVTVIGEDGDGVRFADMIGDGRDDYLWVSEEGRVICYSNKAGDSRGKPPGNRKRCRRQQRPNPLRRHQGDGRDDYLVVNNNGGIEAWLNTGTGDKPAWVSQGEVASGIGAAAGVRVADVNKDGRADYLWLSDEGAVTSYTNTQGASSGAVDSWRNVGAADGAYPGRVTWVPQGEIASDTGAASEWLKGCNAEDSPAPPGTIKSPDEVCSPVGNDGTDLKTIKNWQDWDIDKALTDSIGQFKPGGEKAKIAETFGAVFENSPLGLDFSFANGPLTIISGFGLFSWAAIPAGFAGIGGAMLGYANPAISEPKFDLVADISDQMGDLMNITATAIENLAVQVLEETPINDPDSDLNDGGLAEPIDVPVLSERMLRRLTSNLINELWERPAQQAFIAKTTPGQAGFNPCDSPPEAWVNSIWCDKDVDALGDYDMSLEMVIRPVVKRQGLTAEFQAARSQGRTYDYLMNILGDEIEDWQFVAFNMPVCDLSIPAPEDEFSDWPEPAQ
ncbi:hypothetical protein BDV12DRAFT_204162 [Aspergillus spectabilis]